MTVTFFQGIYGSEHEEESAVIARLWSARTTQAQSQIYLRHFSEAVLPALRRFEGYVSSTVLKRPTEAAIEILVITVWKSFAAIDAFAGADREAAVVAPEAAALLTDYDRRVHHFEIASMDGVFFR
jgi:heme-degrading monooxygenase HmoA